MLVRGKCEPVRAALVLAPCLLLLAASVTPAREVLTPEEQAERELERKRQAQPVLECEPRSLRAEVKRGETSALRLTIRNAGGRTLRWSVKSAPGWVRMDVLSGEVGFGESRTVGLAVRSETLQPGTSRGEIVIEAPGATGSPATVRVSVKVLPREEESAREPSTRAPEVRKRRTREPPERATSPRFSEAPTRQQEEGARIVVGGGLLTGSIAAGGRIFLELGKGRHAAVISAGWGNEPTETGTVVDAFSVSYEYELSVRYGAGVVYRYYGNLSGRAAWFGEVGIQLLMADLSLDREASYGTSSGAFSPYATLGGGLRISLGSGAKPIFAEFSAALLAGGAEDLGRSYDLLAGRVEPYPATSYYRVTAGLGMRF